MMARLVVDLAKSDFLRRGRKFTCSIALAALLAGCAVTTPASIISTTGQLPQSNTVQLAPFETDGSLRAAFGQALGNALTAQSVHVAASAPVIAEFAIAARDARTGVADPAASSADDVAWDSDPRGRRMFDGCDAQRLRATLVLLDRASGEIRYRGVGESTLCDFGDADLAELADTLVTDARGAITAQ